MQFYFRIPVSWTKFPSLSGHPKQGSTRVVFSHFVHFFPIEIFIKVFQFLNLSRMIGDYLKISLENYLYKSIYELRPKEGRHRETLEDTEPGSDL